MTQAKQGDSVRIHYTGRLEDGTVFDRSEPRGPLEFTLGEGRIIPGFEEAVQGMEQGEIKTVTIPPEQAYGEVRDELILTVPAVQLPEGFAPEVGKQLEMRTGEGETVPVRVVEVGENAVRLDANHPLAGKELIFDLELVAIG